MPTSCNNDCFETVQIVYRDNTGSNSTPGVTTNDLNFTPATGALTSTVNGVSDTVILTAAVTGAQTPITPVDSTTLDLSVSGTDNHTLTGTVKISNTSGNRLTTDGTGLLVPQTTNTLTFDSSTNALTTNVNGITATQVLPFGTSGGGTQTPITPVDTSTIDLTANGTDNHTLTAAVKVSATSGNTITVNSDGLFVAAGAVTTGNLLGDNTVTVATGTSRLVGGNATVSFPLKFGTGGTAVTAPTTAGGYQLQSTDGSIVVTNPTAGVLNFAAAAPANDFYSPDTAATGTVTATRKTQSAFTHYLTPFTAPRIHILSTAGAVLGDSMSVSVGYQGTDVLPGATNLEIRNGTAGGTLIETFTDGSGIEGRYKFNGTAWVKVQ